jgi:hypothetical protein
MAEGDSKLTYEAIPQQLQNECNQSYRQMQIVLMSIMNILEYQAAILLST